MHSLIHECRKIAIEQGIFYAYNKETGKVQKVIALDGETFVFAPEGEDNVYKTKRTTNH